MAAVNGAPRIAIGQLGMHWEGDANTAAVCRAIASAAREGCSLALFSELALTGYHRRIAEMAVPARVAGWLAQVQAACATHGIAAGVGLPGFTAEGRILNRYAFVDADGQPAWHVDKAGLTDAEATFFVPGAGRAVRALAGSRWSCVLCREVEDEIAFDPGEGPDFIAWPGLMGPQPGEEHLDVPPHVQRAQRLAAGVQAWVVQVNWPQTLNYPELSAHTGRSVVIAPDGRIALHLPRAEPGIGFFTPGDPAARWQPENPAV